MEKYAFWTEFEEGGRSWLSQWLRLTATLWNLFFKLVRVIEYEPYFVWNVELHVTRHPRTSSLFQTDIKVYRCPDGARHIHTHLVACVPSSRFKEYYRTWHEKNIHYIIRRLVGRDRKKHILIRVINSKYYYVDDSILITTLKYIFTWIWPLILVSLPLKGQIL